MLKGFYVHNHIVILECLVYPFWDIYIKVVRNTSNNLPILFFYAFILFVIVWPPFSVFLIKIFASSHLVKIIPVI